MRWKKLGLLIEPDLQTSWMSSYCGPSFVQVEENKIIIFMQGRGDENISRIGKMVLDEYFHIVYTESIPLLSEGEIGYFDESGVSYPWIVTDGDTEYLYYTGWVAGGIGGFQNFVGLAVRSDKRKPFVRLQRVPIMDRTDQEPVGVGSVSVLKENEIWKMWYTSFVKWEKTSNGLKHFYRICYAESDDGIHWKRDGKVAIDFANEEEYAIAKPCVIKENGIYKMWYSYRGEHYRIGYAESHDGITWTRKDEISGIHSSESGWDSNMIEYAYIFDFKNKRYMLYNGNGYGQSGLGLAVLEEY